MGLWGGEEVYLKGNQVGVGYGYVGIDIEGVMFGAAVIRYRNPADGYIQF